MDPQNDEGIVPLPYVALIFSFFQIAIYLTSNYYISYEEVNISWVKVIDEFQLWRVMVAHHFHFTKTHLFWSVLSLLTVGRFLEKKLTKTAMIIIINLNGIVSNIIFVCLNVIICPREHGLELEEISCGFTNLTLGFRVILAYIQEPRNYEADALFGLYPMVLPAYWAPWQPFLEIIVLKICLKETCVAFPISTTLSGLLLSHVAHLFPQKWIFLSATADNHENNEVDSNDSSGFASPALSAEVLRAIQTNHANINHYTNQNGVIRHSFPQQDAHINRSLRFQLMLHQQLQRQARHRGRKS